MSGNNEVGSTPNDYAVLDAIDAAHRESVRQFPQHVLDDTHPREEPDTDDDFAEAEDFLAERRRHEEPRPKPAPLAAAQRVRAVLAADPDLATKALTRGDVAVLVVEDAWAMAVLDAWSRAHWDSSAVRHDRHDRHPRARRMPYSVCWGTSPSKGGIAESESAVTAGVREGSGVVIAVSDLEVLPAAIRASVDLVVEIPPLSAAGLRSVAAAVARGRAAVVPRGLPSAVQPEHLALALRPQQSAVDFVSRLRRLVEADQKASARGKSKPPRWTLDRLHGQPDVVAFGQALAADLADYRAGRLPWADVAPGVLLSGPPGCGKTIAAQALAWECGVPLIATSYSEWQGAGREGHLGELTKCLRDHFAQARRVAPCILFIDELDSVGTRGGGTSRHDNWTTAVVNLLLEELDGVAGRNGVVVVAASNYPDKVDPAIRRSGRLDKEIRLLLPDASALEDIFREYVGDAFPEDDLRRLATAGLGGSGADVARWCRGGRQRARHARRDLTVDDVLQEVRGSVDDRDPALARRVAVHEAGHAVVGAIERPGSIVSLTVRAGAVSEGGSLTRQPVGEGMLSTVEGLLRETLGGRAAEEVVLGEASAGSGGRETSDLATVTVLAARMEASLGFRGLTWRGDATAESLPAMLAVDKGLAERVEARLQQALSGARELLHRHRRALDAVAAALLERETLSGTEVESIVAAHPPEQRQVPRIPAVPAVVRECVR